VQVTRLWQGLDARVQALSPQAHDHLLAKTSHMPHLVAALLAVCVGRTQPRRVGPFCGAGFFDTTRIAEGDPQLCGISSAPTSLRSTMNFKAFSREADHLLNIFKKRRPGNACQVSANKPGTPARIDPGPRDSLVNTANNVTIYPCRVLAGSVRVPGDKSISHRAAMLAALTIGPSRLKGFLRSEDCLNTLKAIACLGARVEITPECIQVTGRPWACPRQPLDLGNSGTGLRLLAGLLAGQPWTTELTGDKSLRSRPMQRIQAPLEQMGARVELMGAGELCAHPHYRRRLAGA